MNNYKKIGLTALAGSLVSLGSAGAGEMSVSGGINTTLKFGHGGGNTSRTIGSDRDVTFSGGGELDNGTTFSVSTTSVDSLALSASTTTITTPSLGSFTLGASYGSAAGSFDEEVPQAYEQVSDAKQTMSNQVGDFMDNNSVVYTAPTFEFGGVSATLKLGYSPQASDSNTATGDGGSVTYSATVGSGKEAGITLAYENLTLGFYGAERERTVPQAAQSSGQFQTDEFNGVWYAKYSFGPVSIGYSESYLDAGVSETDNVATGADKTYRTSGGIFENTQMSIAFNVNENFSISYTDSEDVYDAQSMNKSGTETADVTSDIEAIQIAYSMGGMSIKAYQMEATNSAFNATSDKGKETEIALGLAF